MPSDLTPTRYKRKYADGEKVAFSDLRQAYQIAAQMVAEGGDEYIPLFERMDKEMEMRQDKRRIRAKALEVAKQDI